MASDEDFLGALVSGALSRDFSEICRAGRGAGNFDFDAEGTLQFLRMGTPS